MYMANAHSRVNRPEIPVGREHLVRISCLAYACRRFLRNSPSYAIPANHRSKDFRLAIILLLLTIALAGFLLHEVTRTKQDLTVVANFDVPLTQSLARLHEFGLRRRLAFERWFGALNAAEPNREIVAEATENYALFTRKLTDEFSTARRIIDAYPKNAPGSHTLAEVETLLDQIQPA